MDNQLAALPALLTDWYAKNARDLPWRHDREPYHIWLSEIMLQQTRVEAVRGYYTRFLSALPTIADLANADPDRLNKLWEGLGYYSRVRNLQKAAKEIMSTYSGRFPQTHAEILALPGIGPYTAGAISSICFGLPEPAVDGNVLRVISRLTASDAPIDQPKTKAAIHALLKALYPAQDPGTFTQSLMELGATVCVPNGAPNCAVCPASSICAAKQAGKERLLPVKAGKKPRRIEEMTVLHMTCGNKVALRKRGSQGLLAGLWEFPNVPGKRSDREALALAAEWGVHPTNIRRSAEKTHIFTHVEWHMICYYLDCSEEAAPFFWADPEVRRTEVALPTAFRIFTEEEP